MTKLHLILLSFALALTGCINIPHSYKGKSRHWGGYEPDKIYVLKRSVFVMKADDGLAGARLALVPERAFRVPSGLGRHNSAPSSVEAYRRDPVAASTIPLQNTSYSVQNEVYDIVVTGVRLRPSRIKRNRGLNLWYGHHDELTPFAQILDGPLKGQEVDITDVSDYYQINDSGPFMYRPIALLLTAEQ